MSNPEELAAEEQGGSHSSFNEHLKENTASGEQFEAQISSAAFKVGAERFKHTIGMMCVREPRVLPSVQ